MRPRLGGIEFFDLASYPANVIERAFFGIRAYGKGAPPTCTTRRREFVYPRGVIIVHVGLARIESRALADYRIARGAEPVEWQFESTYRIRQKLIMTIRAGMSGDRFLLVRAGRIVVGGDVVSVRLCRGETAHDRTVWEDYLVVVSTVGGTFGCHTTDVITIDVLNFFAKVFIAKPFYRHVESYRGTSTIFETVS